jgi:hypothetical protein
MRSRTDSELRTIAEKASSHGDNGRMMEPARETKDLGKISHSA